MTVNVANDFFKSSDGTSDVGYNVWWGKGYPKAIFQLAHGMAEHIDRYDRFARFLANRGYAVFGNNHIGHGNSVISDDDLGHISGKDGYLNMTKDLRLLTQIAKERYPDIPLILFGHSMGSFLARNYAELWGNELDGLILCGTSGSNPLAPLGLAVIKLLSAVKGERYRSKLVDFMAFGSYNEKYPEARTRFDWLSANEENVDAYMEDELCGHVFSLSGFYNLMTLLKTVTRKDWASTIRKDLPVLLISGEDDPVGGFKKGVVETANLLRSAGVKSVSLIFYEGMRHELLNEAENERISEDILAWSRTACGIVE